MRFTPYPPETRDKARVLFETTDLALRAIAREAGVSHTAVGDWARCDNWRRPASAASPEPDAPGPPRQRARPPTLKQVRCGFRAMITDTAAEARRLLADLRACPPLADAAERERHARMLASLVRTQRQLDELLTRAEAAAPSRRAQRQGDAHGPGRSLAELRDEFVGLLGRVMAEEQDPRSPGPVHPAGAGAA